MRFMQLGSNAQSPRRSVARAPLVISFCAILAFGASQLFVGGDSPRKAEHGAFGHDHPVTSHAHIGALPPGLEALQLPPGSNDPSGQRGSGGRAVAHHAGGKRITRTAITRRAPDARLFYVGGEIGLEPTLGVNRKGTIFYVAAKSGPFRAVVMRSRDDGASWKDISPRLHKTTQDPYVWVDKKTGRLFDVDFAAGLQVSFTDDEGKSWTSSTVPQSWHMDHQNLFAGPPPEGGSKPGGYPNVVYMCSIGGGALAGFGTATTCSRSLDGGITFVPTGEPAFFDGSNDDVGHFGIAGHCGGETGHGIADRRGFIYLARGWCGQPWVAISQDEGASWKRVQVADNGIPSFPEGIQEHEAGVAVDDAGNIYVVWTARNRLPYLAISRNGGKSFGKPMMIGHPGVKETWGPTIDVGDNGKIAISYIGSTNAPGGKSPTGEGPKYEKATWNGYVTITAEALSSDPVFYTASINDPKDPFVKGECPIVRCQQQFDFIDVVVGPDGTPWTSMVDGCVDGECPRLGLAIVGRLVGGPSLGSGY